MDLWNLSAQWAGFHSVDFIHFGLGFKSANLFDLEINR